MFRIQTKSERIAQAEQGDGHSMRTSRSSSNNCKDRCARLSRKTKTQRIQQNNCYVNCKKSKKTPVWNSPNRRGSFTEKRSPPKRRPSPKRRSPPKRSPRNNSRSRSPSSRGISRADCKSRCRNLPTANKSQRRQQNNCYVNCKK